MAQIMQVFSVARRLYSPDSVPWAQLGLTNNLQLLTERFKLKNIGQSEPTPATPAQLVASDGEFVSAGTTYAIQQLAIEVNAVECHIAAQSSVADLLVDELEGLLREISASKSGPHEYTRTYQTIVVAKLDVNFDVMFSDTLRSYLSEDVLPRLKVKTAEPHIRLARLSWQVLYSVETADVTYLPKVLTVEPRAGTKIADTIYYTHSPTAYDTHIEIIHAFEKRFRRSNNG